MDIFKSLPLIYYSCYSDMPFQVVVIDWTWNDPWKLVSKLIKCFNEKYEINVLKGSTYPLLWINLPHIWGKLILLTTLFETAITPSSTQCSNIILYG